MPRRLHSALSLLLLVVMTACQVASEAPAPSPTVASSGAASPTTRAVTPSPARSTAAASASTPASAAPRRTGLMLWHGFPAGSAEEQALLALVEEARVQFPEQPIETRGLPGDELIDRFEIEAVAGGGPDLLLAANEQLGRQARAGLLLPVSAPDATYAPNALGSMTVNGQLYGLPLGRTTVALYHNLGLVATSPSSTTALLDLAKGGTPIVLVRSIYHNFGLIGAFGGRLWDETGRCVADVGGVADALRYMGELKAAGVNFVASGAEAEALFREGQAAVTINGSWLLDDFRAALGDQLGVAAMPAGPAGPAAPLVIATGFVVNANTATPDAASALAQFLSAASAQQQWVERTATVPANPEVAIADDDVGGLAAAALTGVARPNWPELNTFWGPFDAALGAVLDANADPVVAVEEACSAVNQRNGK